MKTIESVYNKIKFGDIMLVQLNGEETPRLVCVVGLDIMDMAPCVICTEYKHFNFGLHMGKGDPELITLVEWSEQHNVLGHWRKMPSFKNLLKAYRKSRSN